MTWGGGGVRGRWAALERGGKLGWVRSVENN